MVFHGSAEGGRFKARATCVVVSIICFCFFCFRLISHGCC